MSCTRSAGNGNDPVVGLPPAVHTCARVTTTGPSDNGDAELLAAWAAGDARAGNQLFERYFDLLFRFFRTKVDDAAEDLVQQTFLGLVRTGAPSSFDSSFRAYVYTAARNVLYRHLTTRAAKLGPVDFGVDSVAALSPSPSTWAAEREDLHLLHEGLRRLPVELQVTLELYHLEGLEGDEVAQVMDVPVGTVRSRLRRGLRRLKQEIRELAADPELVDRSLSSLSTRGT